MCSLSIRVLVSHNFFAVSAVLQCLLSPTSSSVNIKIRSGITTSHARLISRTIYAPFRVCDCLATVTMVLVFISRVYRSCALKRLGTFNDTYILNRPSVSRDRCPPTEKDSIGIDTGLFCTP